MLRLFHVVVRVRAWDEDNSRRMAKIAKLLGKEKAEAGNDGCDGDDDDDDDDEREEDDEEEEEDDRRGSGKKTTPRCTVAV